IRVDRASVKAVIIGREWQGQQAKFGEGRPVCLVVAFRILQAITALFKVVVALKKALQGAFQGELFFSEIKIHGVFLCVACAPYCGRGAAQAISGWPLDSQYGFADDGFLYLASTAVYRRFSQIEVATGGVIAFGSEAF